MHDLVHHTCSIDSLCDSALGERQFLPLKRPLSFFLLFMTRFALAGGLYPFVGLSFLSLACTTSFVATESHKRGETRASAQSGFLGARARSPTQVGVSLFVKIRTNKGGTTLLYS